MDIVNGPPGSPNDLLTTRATRASVGDISEMTLWRWTRDLAFPPPDVIIGRRKFWRRATRDRWVAAQAAKSTAE
jgi:predicted DNA-binding transcriptional regulator AlpA